MARQVGRDADPAARQAGGDAGPHRPVEADPVDQHDRRPRLRARRPRARRGGFRPAHAAPSAKAGTTSSTNRRSDRRFASKSIALSTQSAYWSKPSAA